MTLRNANVMSPKVFPLSTTFLILPQSLSKSVYANIYTPNESLPLLSIQIKDPGNMEFCPPNDTMATFWFNHGLSQCAMTTVSASIICGFLIIFGAAQLLVYRKYSIAIEQNHLHKSVLYNVQVFLLLLMPTLAIARFLVEGLKFNDRQFYGYMVSCHFRNLFLK
jgi:Mitochondrial ABC-transporter N-terminal five TM region